MYILLETEDFGYLEDTMKAVHTNLQKYFQVAVMSPVYYSNCNNDTVKVHFKIEPLIWQEDVTLEKFIQEVKGTVIVVGNNTIDTYKK